MDFAKVFLDAMDGIENGWRAGRNFLDYFKNYKFFKVNCRRADKFTFIDCEFFADVLLFEKRCLHDFRENLLNSSIIL